MATPKRQDTQPATAPNEAVTPTAELPKEAPVAPEAADDLPSNENPPEEKAEDTPAVNEEVPPAPQPAVKKEVVHPTIVGATPTAPLSPKDERDLKIIRANLEIYEERMSRPILNEDLIYSGYAIFSETLAIVRSNPVPAIVKELHTFFVKHKDGLMRETHGLRGIESQSNRLARGKVELMYSLFRNASLGFPRPIDEAMFLSNFDNQATECAALLSVVMSYKKKGA